MLEDRHGTGMRKRLGDALSGVLLCFALTSSAASADRDLALVSPSRLADVGFDDAGLAL
jgi:hypothetical protein